MQDPAILPHRFYPQHVGLSNSILMIYLKDVGLKIALLGYTQRRYTQQNHTLDIIKDCRTQQYHSRNIDPATAPSSTPKERRTQQQNFQNIFKHTVQHYCLQDIPREWNTQQYHKQGVFTECRISNIALRISKECIT